MSDQKKNTKLLYVAAIAFIIWGVLGMLDVKNYTYSGYSANNNEIFNIEADGPAAAAGMQVGDIIITNGGIDVNDSKAFSERDRPSIGDTREFVVERNGEEHTLQLTFAGQSSESKTLNHMGTLMGMIFIILGIFTFRKIKNNLSYAFAIFAVMFGYIFMNGPHISAGILNNIVNSIDSTIVFLSFAFMAVFMLKYPPKSAMLQKSNGYRTMFYPAIITIVMLWVLNLFQPESNPTLGTVFQVIIALTIIFYFGVALISLIKKYAKSSADDRTTNGLNYMLLAVVLGLAPILISFIISQLSPKTQIPGNDYLFLTFLLIPIFCSMALTRQANSKE